MGYMDMAFALDPSVLQFVEPLGPGQIVDRQSPVSVPEGRLKVSIEDQNRKLLLRVVSFQNPAGVKQSANTKTAIKSYFAMGNHVLEGREHDQNNNEPGLVHAFDKAVMERLACNVDADKPIHKILQICVFRGRAENFVGYVHISVSDIIKASNDLPSSGCTYSAWYTIFPRSSFIVGCPIGCVTPHCVKPWSEEPVDNTFHSSVSLSETRLESSHSTIPDEPMEKTNHFNTEEADGAAASSTKCRRPRTAKNFSKYGRVASVCQTLTRKVQSRKSSDRPNTPITVNLSNDVKSSEHSSSSSSVDIGYGSSANSTASENAPNSSSLAADFSNRPASGLLTLRSLSFLVAKVRPNLKRARRSFNLGDSRRFNSPANQSSSTFRRSEEIISTHLTVPTDLALHSEELADGLDLLKSDKIAEGAGRRRKYVSKQQSFDSERDGHVSQRALSEIDGKPPCPPLRTKSMPINKSASPIDSYPVSHKPADKSDPIPRTKSYSTSHASHLDSSSSGNDTVRSMTGLRSKKIISKTNSTNTIPLDQSKNVVKPRLHRKSKQRNFVKSSKSFPPTHDIQHNSELDNVYEVLLSLKNMSTKSSIENNCDHCQVDENIASGKASAFVNKNDRHASVSEISTSGAAVAHKRLDGSEVQLHDSTPGENTKSSSRRRNWPSLRKQLQQTLSAPSRVDCKRPEKSSTEVKASPGRGASSRAVRKVVPTLGNVEYSDDEYLSCTEQIRSASSSMASSYASLCGVTT